MINREGGKTVITLPKPAHGNTLTDEVSGDAEPLTLPSPERVLDNDAGAAPTQGPGDKPTRGPFVPLLLTLLALLTWSGTQTWQLFSDRQTLKTAHASQQQTVDNSAKLRSSLDTLAADTQRLAEAGNKSARVLVEELRKRGVTITAPKPTP